MRPAGEVRQALLSAARALVTPERAPTLAELAAHAKVGTQACRHTVANMRRYGALQIVRTRRQPGRNRPVAEYAPGALEPSGQGQGAALAEVLRCWA